MPEQKRRYIVVFEALIGPTKGAITWSAHQNEESFDKWYEGKMEDGSSLPIKEAYKVHAKGVTQEQAIGMVRSSLRGYEALLLK